MSHRPGWPGTTTDREPPDEVGGAQATNPERRPNVWSPPDDIDPTTIADPADAAEQLRRRRRRARRAAWRTWHHLHDRGLMSPVVDETLQRIVKEAG